MFRRNWLSTAVISILIAYIVFILGSWLWSAAMPSSSIRPLLSESGIRWFFGTFVANLAKYRSMPKKWTGTYTETTVSASCSPQ